MYKFNINSFIVGSTEGDIEIVPKGINVIIGPNNSGKSRLLKDFRDYLNGRKEHTKILKEIEYEAPRNLDELDNRYNISKKITRDIHGNWRLRVYSNTNTNEIGIYDSFDSYYSKNLHSFSGDWKKQYEHIIEEQNPTFFEYLGALFFQYVGTEERLLISKTQKDYGLDSDNLNFLSSFKFQHKILSALRTNVLKLFKKDIVLDAQTLGDRLTFRVGNNFDYVDSVNNLSAENSTKLFNESKLDDQGDGLKSYVSTFLSLKSSDADILLLDEPEAFLHPPLARQLGELIGESESKDKQIFVATHSVEILKGILTKCQNVNIIRITQPESNNNEIQIVDEKILREILKSPLLRVSRVLEGLFCEKVVITEAESDELVYQELIEKLFPQSGLHFVHGQNKQTLADIANLYKEIGIRYEIITDFDVLRVSSDFKKFLLLMPIDESEVDKNLNYANKLRESINDSIGTVGLSEKEIEEKQKSKRDEVYHKMGISFFEYDVQVQIKKALEMFSCNHLHILESGELETLLIPYGLNYMDKKEWIGEAVNLIEEIDKSQITDDSYLYRFLSNIVGDLRG